MSVISGSLRHAVLPYEFLKSSPAVYVKLPKVTGERSQSKRKAISLEDFNKIMERFPPTDRFGLAIMIGWYTGMRISEVHALTWDDIDSDKGIITVNKQVGKRNFGIDVRELYKLKGKKEEKSAWYFKDTKATKSNRKLKIGETLIEALKDHKAIQDANIELYGEYYTKIYAKEEPDEKGNKICRLMEIEASVPVTLPELKLIMRRENGQFSSTDSFKYPSRIIHYGLGIPHFDFHSMRHSHAAALVANKVPFKTIQDRLGLEKIETTLQTYTHVTEEMELEAVDVFEQFMKCTSQRFLDTCK